MSGTAWAAVLALLAAAGPARAAELVVEADPRVELLSVVHVLALEQDPGLGGLAPSGRPFADAVRQRFAPFKGHAAVSAYVQARRRGMDFPQAFFFILELSAPPALAGRPQDSPWSQSFGRALGGEEGIERFRRALADFAQASRFGEFYAAQRPAYRELEDALKAELAPRRDVALLEEYTGLEARARYTWIVTPLSAGASTSKVVLGSPDRVWSLIGPQGVFDGKRAFHFAQERYRLWHELNHTLLDRLLEEHADRLLESEPLAAGARPKCPGDWDRCVAEHVAKGLARRLWAWAGETGATPVEALPPAAMNDALPYWDVMEGAFAEYEAQRARWKDFAAFFPRLLDRFAERARAERSKGRTQPARGGGMVLKPGQGVPPQTFFLGDEASPAGAARQRAADRYRSGDMEEALQGFLDAARLDAKDPRALMGAAIVLRVNGRRREAVKLLDRALPLCAGRAAGLRADAAALRGSVWIELQRPDLARRDFEEALKHAPPSFTRRGELEKALRELSR